MKYITFLILIFGPVGITLYTGEYRWLLMWVFVLGFDL